MINNTTTESKMTTTTVFPKGMDYENLSEEKKALAEAIRALEGYRRYGESMSRKGMGYEPSGLERTVDCLKLMFDA